MISNKKVVDNRKEDSIKEDQCDREVDKPRLLLVKDLSKIFDGSAGKVVALDRINLQIMKGEFVSIIGPSGSGKSTSVLFLFFVEHDRCFRQTNPRQSIHQRC